jgi:FkbM family methyltransferase
MKKVIYDLGANNGDDIPYYLKKCDLVVAVEANPELCRLIVQRFESEISQGKVVVENKVISQKKQNSPVPFFLHKKNHVLSQFPRPSESKLSQFQEIELFSSTVPELIEKWGDPYYIKIDLENYDAPVLKSIFDAGIYPYYLSAESHSAEIFCLLVVQGNYKSFKLVEGRTIHSKFFNHEIETIQGKEYHNFPHHSAGPFGNDIPGPWFTADNFIRLLGVQGLGWKDIHVTRESDPNPHARINLKITS